MVIDNILATDFAKHNSLVDNFKSKNGTLDKNNEEDRKFVMNTMVHACDIGNPCLKFENYMNWSYLVT